MAKGCARTAVLPALVMLVLGSAPGLRGQGVVVSELTVVLRIPGLFAVETEAAPGAVVQQGSYARADGATRLYISGNAPWRLLAEVRTRMQVAVRLSSEAPGVQVMGGGAAGDASAARPGDDGAFMGIGAGMREVARGPRGDRMALSVDYRWRGAGGPPDVLYTVVAD